MKMLIAAFVLLGCVGWWSALSGIASYSTGTNGTEIAYHATSGSRIFAGAYGTFLFAFAFACYRKVKKTWEVGFGLLAIAWVWSLIYAAPVVLAPGQGGFLALGLIAAASALACLYWGAWWRRQKGYFYARGG